MQPKICYKGRYPHQIKSVNKDLTLDEMQNKYIFNKAFPFMFQYFIRGNEYIFYLKVNII